MTFTGSLRRASGVRRFAFLAACCAIAAGRQSAFAQSQEVHISVQVRRLDGDPVGNLKSKNFHVSANGQSLFVTLARPSLKKVAPDSVQTRLLLILPSATFSNAGDPLSEAIDQLKPAWRAGWQIAVLTPQGALTPYLASEQSLVRAVQQPTVTPISYRAAIDSLKDFSGRRLVMVVWDRDYGTLFALRKAARDVQAMLYNIGGNPEDNYSYGEAEKGSTSSLPAYGTNLNGASSGPSVGGLAVVNNTEIWSAPVALAIDDVHAERSFWTAIRDAMNDARNYYDLRIQMDPSIAQIGLRISADSPLRVTAQAYTFTSDTPPEVVLLSKTR
jgi:hypothetical protein